MWANRDAYDDFLRKLWRRKLAEGDNMNKTYGKTDELQAVDAVTQTRAVGQVAIDASALHATGLGAIGTHRDDVMAWHQLGLEHGTKGGVVSGQLKVIKLFGDLANEMQREWPEQADAIRIVARQVWETLQPKGTRS